MNLNYKEVLIILYDLEIQKKSDKGFANINNGQMGRTYWTCFIIKHNKSYYFESFGGEPDKFLLNHLPKPIIYHNCKFQEINSRLCGLYCLYFIDLIERMSYYDTTSKMYVD